MLVILIQEIFNDLSYHNFDGVFHIQDRFDDHALRKYHEHSSLVAIPLIGGKYLRFALLHLLRIRLANHAFQYHEETQFGLVIVFAGGQELWHIVYHKIKLFGHI